MTVEQELCERLRIHALRKKRAGDPVYGVINEAADTIERLVARCEDKQETINRLSKPSARKYDE